MAIETGDVIRLAAVLSGAISGDIVNVFHVLILDDNELIQQDLLDDLADFLDAVYEHIILQISNVVDFDVIEVFNETKGIAEPAQAWPTQTTGAEGGQVLPSGVAAYGLARTETPGVRGSKYWPKFTEDILLNGVWGVGAVVAVANAMAEAYDAFVGGNGSTVQPGVFSRASEVLSVVTEIAALAVPAYQRRRKRGVGS